METARATFARRSFFVFAIVERIIAAGPNNIGKKRNEIAPNEIPSIEKVLLED